MAKNIEFMGAIFPDVPSIRLPQYGGGLVSFDDTSDGTATAEDIAEGKIAYVNGQRIVGTAHIGHTSAIISYYNGETLITTDTIYDGGDATYSGTTPTKTATAQYTYTFAGWSKTDDNTVDADALTAVTADRSVYACYTETLRTYSVYFYNGATLLQTNTNVAYGSDTSYTGTTPTNPTDPSLGFLGWTRTSGGTVVDANALNNIQSDTNVYAVFEQAVVVAEITDTWDQIIAKIDNGTYSTAYQIGNYKPLDLGTNGILNMQIVAIDEDELTAGGTAPLTFVAMNLLGSPKYFSGAWEDSYIRNDYLGGTILNAFPSNVKARLQTVNKYTMRGYGMADIGQEVLWIPSNWEVLGQTERNGVKYSVFTNYVDNRKKAVTGSSAVQWWVRSFGTGSDFHYCITGNGTGTTLNGANYNSYICLGFCLGSEPETITDSWSTILANTNYATDYSIGDTKYLDLGTEGKHLMEIVAFNEDDRADGNGKAGITWISKDLLYTTERMNSTRTSVGGWQDCSIRNYLRNTIKPLIPSDIRNSIIEVSKVSSIYENGSLSVNGLTTTDDVWIPSSRELNFTTGCETEGARYNSKFIWGDSRQKKLLNNTYHLYNNYSWWTRSTSSNKGFYITTADGNQEEALAINYVGVALGFCTN